MTTSCQRLEGKVAVVTGGASGIGLAAVSRFLDEGAKVVVGDIDQAAAETFAKLLQANGRLDDFGFQYCDTSEERDVERLVRYTVKRFGRLDCYINNAAVSGAYTPLVETSVEDWDKTHAVNMRGVFLGIKHAANQMIAQGDGGSIINVSSIAGRFGSAGGAAYTASKGGVFSVTQSAASQLGQHRIRVNAVAPGAIVTPLTHHNIDPDGMLEIAQDLQPIPKAGVPELLAPTFLYLASDDSAFVSGELLTVDGGASSNGGLNLMDPDGAWGQGIISRAVEAGVGTFDGGNLRRDHSVSNSYPTLEEVAISMRETEPRVVVVTGVSRGLGREACNVLDRLGHTIIGCARSEASIEEISAALHPRHSFSPVDVTDDTAVERWAAAAITEVGVSDLILNNAAVANETKQLWRLPQAEVDRTLLINVGGTANIIRHFVPPMIRQRSGIIVNFSSGWGRTTSEKVAPYCASKWGIEGLHASVRQRAATRSGSGIASSRNHFDRHASPNVRSSGRTLSRCESLG